MILKLKQIPPVQSDTERKKIVLVGSDLFWFVEFVGFVGFDLLW